MTWNSYPKLAQILAEKLQNCVYGSLIFFFQGRSFRGIVLPAEDSTHLPSKHNRIHGRQRSGSRRNCQTRSQTRYGRRLRSSAQIDRHRRRVIRSR